MATALVVQHVDVEGVGRFADWMPVHGLDLRVVRPYDGDPLPERVGDDALIVMGGPMGAYDDADVPWLAATKELLAGAVACGLPTLGVCLGAQLLAVATGGAVERGGAGPELGLDVVRITQADALFEVGELPVVQWHYDTVTELPPDTTVLGSSDRYVTQAFRVGTSAWGVQFHVEATADLVAAWARAEGRPVAEISGAVRDAERALAEAGEQIAGRFAAFVTA